MNFFVKNKRKDKEENSNYKMQNNVKTLGKIRTLTSQSRGDARRKAAKDLSFTDVNCFEDSLVAYVSVFIQQMPLSVRHLSGKCDKIVF